MGQQITENTIRRGSNSGLDDKELAARADAGTGQADQGPMNSDSYSPQDRGGTVMPASSRKRRQPPAFKVTIHAADLSPAEADIRLGKAFDIIFDDIFRLQDEQSKNETGQGGLR